MPRFHPEVARAVLVVFSSAMGAWSFSGAPPSDGRPLFNARCGGCHALDRDKEGPRLRGVYGRTAGSIGTFRYSSALKASGLTWTEETLERWLRDPEALVPDSDMAFHVEDAAERQAIVAYLKSMSGETK